MKHEYYEILVSRNKDNDLNVEEKAILTKHLFSCKKCGELKIDFDGLSGFLNNSVQMKQDAKNIDFRAKKYLVSAAAILVIFGVSFITFMNSDKSGNYNNEVAITDTTQGTDDSSILLSSYFGYTDLDSEEGSVDEEYDAVSSYFSYTSSYED